MKNLEIKNVHENDKHVTTHENFENNHVYLIDGVSHIELGYTSATTFLGKFFEEFNATNIINKYYYIWCRNKSSKYHGMSKKEIKESWKLKGETAKDRGTALHKIFEDIINGKINDAEVPELSNFHAWYNKEVKEPYRTEYTVFGKDELIVGNIDFIYKNNDDELCIVDYKCTDTPSNDSRDKMCIGLDMPDNKITANTIQLNIYKFLLEKYYDVEIKHVYNLYIKDNKCNFVEREILNMETIINE